MRVAADKAEIAQIQLQNKAKLDSNKNAQKNQKAIQDQELADRETFLNTAATLQQSSNKSAQAIGKAAALANLAIKTPEAVASSFAWGAKLGGPILGGVFGAIAASAMAVQASKIASVGNFENGGIVPGTSFSGDRLQANVNSSEMILNRAQQTELFKIANGNGGNSDVLIERLERLENAIMTRPVVLIADDTEIARSTSRGVMNGVEIGRSR